MNAIKAQIETLLYEDAPDFEISKLLKQDIKRYFSTLEESFAQSGGKDFLYKHTKKIDTLVQMVYKIAMRSMFGDFVPMKNSMPITLVALGSYGREQLCVHSDIDLMIVYKETSGYNSKEMIEKMLYILWDAGVKLGHRVHEIDEIFEVSKTDITIKTSMIESRFVDGSKYLWTSIENELNRIRHYQQAEFIEAKVEEMRALHRKFPMTMEPNLKEGVGGFRNANLVYWIGNVLYNVDRIRDLPKSIIDEREYREFRIALEFLFRVRSALHLCTGKKEDKLRLHLIPQIAKYLGYSDTKKAHMKFAKEVTKNLKIIKLFTTIWIDMLDSDSRDSMLRPNSVSDSFDSLLQQLCDAGDHPFDVHPTFLLALSRASYPTKLNNKFYKIIYQMFFAKNSQSILQPLMDTNLLGYVLSPMKQVINLPQFDGYHQYTVGIHSLKALHTLESIEEDKFLKNLFDNLAEEEKALLKLVTILHDSGKGRKEEHESVGVKLFSSFSKKLKVPEHHIKIGKNLILNHSNMSRTAQREDLYIEQTILKFAAIFPTKLELNMIYLLTYSDMSAVGDGIYNNFNRQLIRRLYDQSCIAISHGEKLYETSRRLKKEKILKKNPRFKSLPRTLQRKILQIPSDLLFIKYSASKIIDITEIARGLKDYSFSIDNNKFLTIEIIRKNNLDLSYLLHKLGRLDIVHVDICKLFSNIKYFKISFNEMIDESENMILEEVIHDSLTKVHDMHLPNPNIEENMLSMNCEHSLEHAMMKLQCANQKGLLSYVINIFDKLGIDICSAKIHTRSNKVTDLFLIEKNGNFCNNTDLIIKELTE